MNRLLASASVAAALALAGCQTSSSSTPAATPTTAPSAAAQEKSMPMPAAPVVAKPVAPAPASTMTHSFTKDTPYFLKKPVSGAAPDGTFKSGTKVLVMVPGAPYSKVVSESGVSAYASIEDLEPLGK